jgi:TetR/AcrR family transcriptional regulator, fatty acid metabolism regulator protein
MTVSERGVSLRERQRQERERLILGAASDLFVERGYHDTSMDDIAARVGIAKGTVYLHFASKEDLALALVEQGARAFAQRLDAILASDGTPRAKLEKIFEGAHSAMGEGVSQTFSAIFRNPEVIVRMRERHDDMSAVWREPMRRLSEVLDEGKAAGEFDPEMPTPIMLNLFMGLLAPHRWERPMEGAPPAEIARHISRFFFKGIAPSQPSEHAPPLASSAP